NGRADALGWRADRKPGRDAREDLGLLRRRGEGGGGLPDLTYRADHDHVRGRRGGAFGHRPVPPDVQHHQPDQVSRLFILDAGHGPISGWGPRFVLPAPGWGRSGGPRANVGRNSASWFLKSCRTVAESLKAE